MLKPVAVEEGKRLSESNTSRGVVNGTFYTAEIVDNVAKILGFITE